MSGGIQEGIDGFVAAPAFTRGDDPSVLAGFRDRLSSAEAKELLDYWSNLVSAHGDRIKHRIDPIDFPHLLPAIYIEEWDAEAGENRVRLAGEYHRDLAGRNIVGLTATEHSTESQLAVWRACDKLNFQDGIATLSHYSLTHVQRDYRWIWDLSLPMADRDGNRFVLGYVWAPDRPDRS